MNFLFKNIWFFSFFSLVLFVLFLFAETYLSYYIFGSFALFLLYLRNFFPLKKEVDKKLVFIIFFFLFFSAISMLSSVSFSLSIFVFTRYVLLFSFFLLFLSFDFKESEKKFFLQFLLFSGIFLAAISFLFFLFPHLGRMVPGMNLLFSSYGHNHIGTLFLLLAPIGQYFYLKERKNIYLFTSFILYVFIILSFGRVLIFLSFLQILLFLLFLIREKVSKKLIFLHLALLVFLFTSLCLYFFLQHTPFCKMGEFPYKGQICKSDFSFNIRSFYWEQGWLGFLDKPLFGSGLGTFETVSYKYRQIPELWSSYIHNDYFQMFVEGGVFVGVSFLLFLFFTLKKVVYSLSFKEKESLLGISLLSFLGDIFFDYNFNFFFLALIFLFLCVLLYKEDKYDRAYPVKNLIKTLTFFLVGICLVVSLYATVDGLNYLKKENISFQIFPYFHWHSLIYLQSDKLSLEQKESLSGIYSYSPSFHRKLLTQLDPEQRVEKERIAWNKDPWRKNESFLPEYYLEKKDSVNLEKIMNESLLFFQKSQKEVFFQKESISSRQKETWSRSYIFLAEVKQKEGNLYETAEYLLHAHFFDAWSTGRFSPLFSSILTDLEKKENLLRTKDFLFSVKKIPGEYWGENREVVARIYFEVITQTSWKEDPEELQRFIQKMIEIAPWSIRWFQEGFFIVNQQCIDGTSKKTEHCDSVLQLFNTVYEEVFHSSLENEFFDKVFYKEMNQLKKP